MQKPATLSSPPPHGGSGVSDQSSSRRRHYVIAKSFQFRMIGRFVMITTGSIVLSHLVTLGYLKFREWIDPDSQNIMYVAASLHDTVALAKLLELISGPMLASLLVGVILVSIFGVFYSHRIAGPLFNLKRRLGELEEGDLSLNMRIRKDDEFHDVADVFNQTLERLNMRVRQLEHDVLKETGKNRQLKIRALFGELYDPGVPGISRCLPPAKKAGKSPKQKRKSSQELAPPRTA